MNKIWRAARWGSLSPRHRPVRRLDRDASFTLVLLGICLPISTAFSATTVESVCAPAVLDRRIVETTAAIQTAGTRVTSVPVGPTGFDWNDTTLGVVKGAGGNYLFFGSDGSCHGACNLPKERDGSITRMGGGLANPLGSGAPFEFLLPDSANLPPEILYVGGGPTYRVPDCPGAGCGTGHTLLLVYHAERATYASGYKYPDCDEHGQNCNTHQNGIYSYLGLARSTDEGASWADLGLILQGNIPYAPQLTCGGQGAGNIFDIGNGSLTRGPDGFVYIYFPDRNKTGCASTAMSVARASYVDLVGAVAAGSPPPQFQKYYNPNANTDYGADWTEKGLGGRSTDVLGGNDDQYNMNIVWSGAIDRFVGIFGDGHSVRYAESSDALHWSTPKAIKLTDFNPGRDIVRYASAVGLGSDPAIIGKSFDLYYSQQIFYGANAGWPSVNLKRLRLQCTRP